MSKQGKSRKSLIIGILATVVLLSALLVVVLSACTGTEPAATTEPSVSSDVVEKAELYWNLDRALYDGKSEAGMSSRKIGSDGYYHIRFFKDGKVVELLATDKAMVNNIEVRDLMGIVTDEEGIITDVIPLEQMPVQKLGWKFYVQSVGGNVVKINSSDKFNGMELVLKLENGAKVYDMTTTSGEPGTETQAAINDRVMCVADSEGKLQAIYIYDRSNMEISFEAECQHCKEVVKWVVWKNEKKAPVEGGHFQLGVDVQLTGQQSMKADAKICLDLNGHRIDGAEGKRVYSVHNLNCELAIMDTSEGQTGVIAPHGASDTQGLGVWVRYGAAYLYSGTIDASDSSTNSSGGTAVYVAAGRFFYMYGGELIGGTATPKKNTNGSYSNGVGGTVFIKGGKFVMYDGVIRDGYAKSVKTVKSGKVSYQRGLGGNICMSGGTLEIHGGTIKNGKAGAGGNIFADGVAEIIMDGGTISGGRNTDPGRNCGNVYINTKAIMTMSGGRVEYGVTKNLGGNFVVVGTLKMSGGGVTGGKQLDTDGKAKENANAANIYVTNGTFKMYGGRVDGSVTVMDSKAGDGKQATIALKTHAWIDGSHMGLPGLTIANGNEKTKVVVDSLRKIANIRISASGIFSEETEESNLQYFHSDVAGVDVVYTQGRLAMGKLACLCGSETHFGACDGTELLWGPWTMNTSLPGSEGNYILMTDVELSAQGTIGNAKIPTININLNGHTISGGQRTAQVNAMLSVVDHVGGGVVTGKGPGNDADHSGVFQVLKGGLDLYAGTLKLADDHYTMTNAGVMSCAAGTVVNMYGGTIDARNNGTKGINEGGAIRVSGVLNVYAGTIYGTNTVNNGGAICVWKGGELNVYGGTINGAKTGTGGTIYLKEKATANICGGTITGGSADRSIGTDKEKGKGGNIMVMSGCTFNVSGGKIVNGSATDNGGNVAVVETSYATISGGTIADGDCKGNKTNANANLYVRNNDITISGGEIKGYISLIVSDAKYKDVTVKLSGAPVLNGGSTNVRLYAASAANMPKIEIVGALTGEPGSIGVTMQHKPDVFATGASAADAAVFFSDASGYEVTFDSAAKTLSLNIPRCFCGADSGAKDDSITHKSWCDGQLVMWTEWNGTAALTSGNYYLAKNITGAAAQTLGAADVKLDLAGFSVDAAITTGEGTALKLANGTAAGAITVAGGNVAVYDATVTGDVAYDAGTLTVGATTKIEKLTLAEGMKLTLDGLTADSEIKLAMATAGIFAEGVETDLSAAFKSVDAACEVKYLTDSKQLELAKKAEHSHCWCVKADVIPEGHVCVDDQVWTPIELVGPSFTAADGGYYYMNWKLADKAAKAIIIPDNATVHLCINGAHIRASNVIQLGANSKLIICDCKDSGIITTTKESPVVVKDGQEVTFMSGILAGTYATTASRVSVRVEGGTFNVYGGSVERGAARVADVTDATKKETTLGGNIYMTGGSVNLYGGYVNQGKLPDGTARDITVAGGNLTIAQKAEVSVLYLAAGQTISVVEEDLAAKVRISMEKPGEPITATTNMDVANIFTSLHADYPDFGIVNGNLVLSAPLVEGGHYHCYCVNAEYVPEDHKCTTIQLWQPAEQNSTKLVLKDGDHYFLDWTGYQAKAIEVEAGATAHVCLNGAWIYAMSAVTINDGGTLHVCDCSSGQTGMITRSGNTKSTAPFNMTTGTQTVHFWSGRVSGTGNGSSTLTLNMSGGKPTFNLYGGKITGGSNSNHGGNLSMSGVNAKFNMFGGTIENGTVASGKHGGNVYVLRGEFVMHGGKIVGGTAGGKGGNVMILPQSGATATFTMNGGVIEGGSAANGGSVCLNALSGSKALFVMNGGTIKGGTATTNGGTVFVNSGLDTLTVNGGTIETGTATKGACIYNNGGNITVATGAVVGAITTP